MLNSLHCNLEPMFANIINGVQYCVANKNKYGLCILQTLNVSVCSTLHYKHLNHYELHCRWLGHLVANGSVKNDGKFVGLVSA